MKTLLPEEVACVAMFGVMLLAISTILLYTGFIAAHTLFG